MQFKMKSSLPISTMFLPGMTSKESNLSTITNSGSTPGLTLPPPSGSTPGLTLPPPSGSTFILPPPGVSRVGFKMSGSTPSPMLPINVATPTRVQSSKDLGPGLALSLMNSEVSKGVLNVDTNSYFSKQIRPRQIETPLSKKFNIDLPIPGEIGPYKKETPDSLSFLLPTVENSDMVLNKGQQIPYPELIQTNGLPLHK